MRGGTYLFTVVTFDRRPVLGTAVARAALGAAVRRVRADHPFTLDAVVVLPDHSHAVWTLPPGDADFSTRWRLIKARFTASVGRDEIPPSSGAGVGDDGESREREGRDRGEDGGIASHPTYSRESRGERRVWQPRFWEHLIRDDDDLHQHFDYIHYNPVKHGRARCPHAWAASSFRRFVRENRYPADWCCQCDRPTTAPPPPDVAVDL